MDDIGEAFSDQQKRIAALESELARVREQSERMLRMLRLSQWKKVMASDFYTCRFCGALKHNGCNHGCELAAEVNG